MALEFLRKPKPDWQNQTLETASETTSHVAQPTATITLSTAVEMKAAKKHAWAQAVKTSRRRWLLLAALRSGQITREAISTEDLAALDAMQEMERRWAFVKRSTRLSKTGLAGLLVALTAHATSITGSCGNQMIRYPHLFKFSMLAGALAIAALAAALALWMAQRWFL